MKRKTVIKGNKYNQYFNKTPLEGNRNKNKATNKY